MGSRFGPIHSPAEEVVARSFASLSDAFISAREGSWDKGQRTKSYLRRTCSGTELLIISRTCSKMELIRVGKPRPWTKCLV